MNLISEESEFIKTLPGLTTHQMCTCGTECQVTLKHRTCKTQTNLLNTDYSRLLGHNAVMNGKTLLIFWKRLLSMTTETASSSEMKGVP